MTFNHFSYNAISELTLADPWGLLVRSKHRQQKRIATLRKRMNGVNLDRLSYIMINRSIRRQEFTAVGAVNANNNLIDLLIKHPDTAQHRAILAVSQILPELFDQVTFTIGSLRKSITRGQRRYGSKGYGMNMWSDIITHIKDARDMHIQFDEVIDDPDLVNPLEPALIAELTKLRAKFNTAQSIANLFDIADRLHEISYAIDPKMANKAFHYMTPAPKRMRNKVSVNEWITNTHDMIKYGSLFHHCLGSYVNHYESLEWFVRHGSAIGQVVYDNNSKQFTVNQCFGPYDRHTTESKALKRRLEGLNTLGYTLETLSDDIKKCQKFPNWEGKECLFGGKNEAEGPFDEMEEAPF